MRKTYNNYLGGNFKKRRTSDKISKAKRSRLMASIRSKNTLFEINFIALIRENITQRFQKHVKSIKGNPDFVFHSARLCVFLDSDFWHGWQYPRWKHLLKSGFWRNKIEANRKRDKKTTNHLKRNGWKVLRIWEHQINSNPLKQIKKIKRIVR
ncbi:MAG: very short patch repair endonuclease [Candidatus Saganbacteria bacterium]|nr:very short patch repair endonuclease [Candidatus Saganbacteria bacterium]